MTVSLDEKLAGLSPERRARIIEAADRLHADYKLLRESPEDCDSRSRPDESRGQENRSG